MKFYLATDPAGKPTWLHRKDEAAKLDKGFEQVDIPTDQASLIARFQEYEDRIFELSQPERVAYDEHLAETDPIALHNGFDPSGELTEALVETEVVFPKAEPSFAPNQIVEWLLDTADQRDIERVFEALGCRIGEAFRHVRRLYPAKS